MDDRRPVPAASPQPVPVERIARRHKTFEPIVIVLDGGEMRAHILNVSATGALVHAQPAPEAGTRVTIRLTGRTIEARVAWREGVRFGIAFQGLLNEAELKRLLG